MISPPPFLDKTVVLDTVEFSSPDGKREIIPLSFFGWNRTVDLLFSKKGVQVQPPKIPKREDVPTAEPVHEQKKPVAEPKSDPVTGSDIKQPPPQRRSEAFNRANRFANALINESGGLIATPPIPKKDGSLEPTSSNVPEIPPETDLEKVRKGATVGFESGEQPSIIESIGEKQRTDLTKQRKFETPEVEQVDSIFQNKFSKRGALLGRDVNFEPEEMEQIERFLDQKKEKIKIFLSDPQNNKLWNDYQQWEKAEGINLLRLTWPNNVVVDGGDIMEIKGESSRVTVPHSIYKLIEQVNAGKGVRKSIDGFKKYGGKIPKESYLYGTSSFEIGKDLNRLLNGKIGDEKTQGGTPQEKDAQKVARLREDGVSEKLIKDKMEAGRLAKLQEEEVKLQQEEEARETLRLENGEQQVGEDAQNIPGKLSKQERINKKIAELGVEGQYNSLEELRELAKQEVEEEDKKTPEPELGDRGQATKMAVEADAAKGPNSELDKNSIVSDFDFESNPEDAKKQKDWLSTISEYTGDIVSGSKEALTIAYNFLFSWTNPAIGTPEFVKSTVDTMLEAGRAPKSTKINQAQEPGASKLTQFSQNQQVGSAKPTKLNPVHEQGAARPTQLSPAGAQATQAAHQSIPTAIPQAIPVPEAPEVFHPLDPKAPWNNWKTAVIVAGILDGLFGDKNRIKMVAWMCDVIFDEDAIPIAESVAAKLNAKKGKTPSGNPVSNYQNVLGNIPQTPTPIQSVTPPNTQNTVVRGRGQTQVAPNGTVTTLTKPAGKTSLSASGKAQKESEEEPANLSLVSKRNMEWIENLSEELGEPLSDEQKRKLRYMEPNELGKMFSQTFAKFQAKHGLKQTEDPHKDLERGITKYYLSKYGDKIDKKILANIIHNKLRALKNSIDIDNTRSMPPEEKAKLQQEEKAQVDEFIKNRKVDLSPLIQNLSFDQRKEAYGMYDDLVKENMEVNKQEPKIAIDNAIKGVREYYKKKKETGPETKVEDVPQEQRRIGGPKENEVYGPDVNPTSEDLNEYEQALAQAMDEGNPTKIRGGTKDTTLTKESAEEYGKYVLSQLKRKVPETLGGGYAPDPIAQNLLKLKDIDDIAAQIPEGSVHIPGGFEAVVFRIPSGEVLRIGPYSHRPNIAEVLQPISVNRFGENVVVEKLPYVDTDSISEADVKEMSQRLKLKGYEFVDPGTDNLGRLPDGSLVAIDPGSVKPRPELIKVLRDEYNLDVEANKKEREDLRIKYSDPAKSPEEKREIWGKIRALVADLRRKRVEFEETIGKRSVSDKETAPQAMIGDNKFGHETNPSVNKPVSNQRKTYDSPEHQQLISLVDRGTEHIEDPKLRELHAEIGKESIQSLPPVIVKSMVENGVIFKSYTNPNDLSEEMGNLYPDLVARLSREGRVLRGMYLPVDKSVNSDGGEDPKVIRGIINHEVGHNLDDLIGISNLVAFREAYANEVDLNTNPLSEYARGVILPNEWLRLPKNEKGDINWNLLKDNLDDLGLHEQQYYGIVNAYKVYWKREHEKVIQEGLDPTEAIQLAKDKAIESVNDVYREQVRTTGYQETVAEFNRYVKDPETDLREAERDFPQLSEIWKTLGLWPKDTDVYNESALLELIEARKDQIESSFNEGLPMIGETSEAQTPNVTKQFNIKEFGRQLLQAVGLVKQEPEKSLSETGHRVNNRVDTFLKESKDLSKKQVKQYGNCMKQIFGRMPDAALERIDEHADGFEFFPNSDELMKKSFEIENPDVIVNTESYKEKFEAFVSNNLGLAGGYFRYPNGSTKFVLDGPSKGPLIGRFGTDGQGMIISRIYSHELGHAIDGRRFEYSNTYEWIHLWEKTVVVPENSLTGFPLTDYAMKDPQEGFAEFCSLVYCGGYNLEEVREKFPEAVEFFKERGLWPGQTKEGMEDDFNKEMKDQTFETQEHMPDFGDWEDEEVSSVPVAKYIKPSTKKPSRNDLRRKWRPNIEKQAAPKEESVWA